MDNKIIWERYGKKRFISTIFLLWSMLLVIIGGLICVWFINAQIGGGPVQPIPKVTERWIYTYNKKEDFVDKAKSICYGKDNHIYAVGGCKGKYFEFFDLFTVISLDTAGDERWRYFYNEAGVTEYDCAYDVVYGEYGNIYAAGRTCTGGPQGGVICGGPQVGSMLTHDFTVINLDSYGNEIWVYKLKNGWANSIVYGEDGNIYATGPCWDEEVESSAIAVVSLDPNGNENWVYMNHKGIYGNCIVYGEDDNLYVVGQGIGNTNSFDIMILSIDANGNERWVKTYDGDAPEPEMDIFDEAHSVAWGKGGYIYATGRLINYNTGPDFVVITLDAAGNEKWIYSYDGAASHYDEAHDIVYGLDDNLYVAGNTLDTLPNGDWQDIFTVTSISKNGTERWMYKFFKRQYYNIAYSIVYGDDENIYAAGTATFNDPALEDFTVISLSNKGQENWVYNFDGTEHANDDACSIVYGEDRYLYVAGYNSDSLTGLDFTVISLPEEMDNSEPDSSVSIR